MEGRTCEISAAGEKKKSGKGAREGTLIWLGGKGKHFFPLNARSVNWRIIRQRWYRSV